MLALKPWTRRAPILPRAEFPFRWMPEEFSTMFNRLFGEPEARWEMTMEEKEKEILVRAELPGFEPAEVKVEVIGEYLKIEAEHKEPPVEEGKEEAERKYVHVKREVTLPAGVEPEKVEAVYRNGVLEVHIPRKPETVGRRIEVKT